MSYFDSCVMCNKPFKQRSFDFAQCTDCLSKYPKCVKCGGVAEQGKTCDNCYYEEKKTQELAEESKTFEQVVDDFFIKKKQWNFDLECIFDRYCTSDDHDSILWHLISHDEKFKRFSFNGWDHFFTLFSIGDSYSSDYRCNLCDAEFWKENMAQEHITRHHNIKVETI